MIGKPLVTSFQPLLIWWWWWWGNKHLFCLGDQCRFNIHLLTFKPMKLLCPPPHPLTCMQRLTDAGGNHNPPWHSCDLIHLLSYKQKQKHLETMNWAVLSMSDRNTLKKILYYGVICDRLHMHKVKQISVGQKILSH